MTFTVKAKALLVTAVFVVMFGATGLLAIDVRRGIAAAGIQTRATFASSALKTVSAFSASYAC